ncbi:hypothetical protein IF2G_09228 [Cordyceps javanica]|nr:hypothetical protein IF2G_09228 [Cordyceps javanica]
MRRPVYKWSWSRVLAGGGYETQPLSPTVSHDALSLHLLGCDESRCSQICHADMELDSINIWRIGRWRLG